MTGLMTIFLVIGAVGLLFLLVSLVVGDVFEAWALISIGREPRFRRFRQPRDCRFSDGVRRFRRYRATLGYGRSAVPCSDLLGRRCVWRDCFLFRKLLYSQQSSSSVSTEDLIGRTAQVVVGIKPGALGQISCRVGEERIEKLARTIDGEEIKAGQMVRIESIGSDSVIVSVDDGSRGFLQFSEKA
jgi:hypothetical protein